MARYDPNITVATTGVNGGSLGGDISVRDPLNWSSANSLTLSARHNVVFLDGSALTNDGGAAITLAADNEARGRGTVQFGAGSSVSTAGPVTIFYNPVGNDKTSVNSFSYTAPTDFSANVSAGSLASYMLVNTIYDLQNIQNNLSANYELGRNIDATSTETWNGETGFSPLGTDVNYNARPYFTGIFQGNGHSISDLFINESTVLNIGLFGYINLGA